MDILANILSPFLMTSIYLNWILEKLIKDINEYIYKEYLLFSPNIVD